MKPVIRIILILLLLICIAVGLYYYFKYSPTIDEEVATDTFRLASWNIRVFSDKSRDDTELKYICQNLIDYDFIAIIELRDEKILQRAESMLLGMGRDYDYQISGEVGRGVKERYAFLYDAGIVKVVKSGQVISDTRDYFIREPYYATFRANKFDFTVIAIHIIWGSKVANRRAEILKLADVYNQIQKVDPSEQDVILVGDFNREPDDKESYAKLLGIPSMIPLFHLPLKSHIRDSSLYDNIWFQSDYLSEYRGVSGIDKFDETDFANDDKLANTSVSDHRPVWAEFYTGKDDDGVILP